MSKHTPGPWTLDAEDRICAAGGPILWGWDDGSIVGSEADRRLIAAAPEMYEALNELLGWMEAAGIDDNNDDRLFTAGMKALRKAEGR